VTRRRRWWIAGAAIVVVAAFLAWAIVPPSEEPFFVYVASLRAAGEAVTVDDLVGKPVPAEENGADELRAGRDWMEATFGRPADWPAVMPWLLDAEDWDRIQPETMQALAEFVPKWEPYLAHVAAARAKPAIQVPLRVDRNAPGGSWGGGSDLIEGAACRLGAAARASPDASRRIDAIAAGLVLAHRFRAASPGEHFTTLDVCAFAAANIRHGLEQARLDSSSARARLDPLLRRRWRESLPAVYRGVRVAYVDLHETLIGDEPPAWTAPAPWWQRAAHALHNSDGMITMDEQLHWFRRGQARVVVEACTILDRAAAAPPASLVAACAALRAEQQAGADDPTGVRKGMTKLMARVARTEAAQALARIALALAEHRATTGAFPSSLDELKPMFPDGVPLDPFTDAPFVYDNTATGVRLASAGRLGDGPPLEEATLRERCLVWELTR
jgi:hypothetical protein